MDNRKQALENLVTASMELQKPIYHTPINLGIKEFKRLVRSQFNNKVLQNRLIRSFKKRGWMEYEGVARHRGNFPTHPEYGKSVEVAMYEDTADRDLSVKVKVKNEQQKQK